jgi:Spy/CpxP family protein refolding chaperone
MLCTLLVMASTAALGSAALGTAALAANDGVPNAVPDATQGVAPTAPQTGANPQAGTPDTRSCRQAKAKSRPQLTPEQKAQRKAARQAAQGTAQAVTKAHKPKQAKLPLC